MEPKYKLVMPDGDERAVRVHWCERKGDTIEMCIAVDHDATPEWLPMETAPKDGTMILLAGEFDHPGDWRIKMGYWAAYENVWRLFGGSWQPTRWMPLPALPSNAEITGRASGPG